MFSDFLNKLEPTNTCETIEWQEVLSVYDKLLGSREPTLFWYLSSGIDLKALVHFNNRDRLLMVIVKYKSYSL